MPLTAEPPELQEKKIGHPGMLYGPLHVHEVQAVTI